MADGQLANVAVLFATYNGVQYVEAQIKSLKENSTPFKLHWTDDHSNDNSRDVVRACAVAESIDLHEWHYPRHQGYPGVFFHLLESVEADVYLFCDQDDIWQPGKIDAVVTSLSPDLTRPVLCLSDPLCFKDSEPASVRPYSEMKGTTLQAALREAHIFVYNTAIGHSIGITRPLRDLFLKHKDIARTYAVAHDWWLHMIAIASGEARALSDAPRTLYRLHGKNAVGVQNPGVKKGIGRIVYMWRYVQRRRGVFAQQAKGFICASTTLPSGGKRDKLIALAELVAQSNRRLSPLALIRLVRSGSMPPIRERAFWFAVACLLSNADVKPPSLLAPSNQAKNQQGDTLQVN